MRVESGGQIPQRGDVFISKSGEARVSLGGRKYRPITASDGKLFAKVNVLVGKLNRAGVGFDQVAIRGGQVDVTYSGMINILSKRRFAKIEVGVNRLAGKINQFATELLETQHALPAARAAVPSGPSFSSRASAIDDDAKEIVRHLKSGRLSAETPALQSRVSRLQAKLLTLQGEHVQRGFDRGSSDDIALQEAIRSVSELETEMLFSPIESALGGGPPPSPASSTSSILSSSSAGSEITTRRTDLEGRKKGLQRSISRSPEGSPRRQQLQGKLDALEDEILVLLDQEADMMTEQRRQRRGGRGG